MAGFQGINASSDVTTLGRAGQIDCRRLGRCALADRCIIYTDVDGVYTADPNIVPLRVVSTRFLMRKCWRWPVLGRKFSRVARSSLRPNIPFQWKSIQASRKERERS
ncbi:MAG: hypothetical protein MRJ92_00310 [Nitrospira sp.]|nr:hypothetical protein [Nitrospira sp.]